MRQEAIARSFLLGALLLAQCLGSRPTGAQNPSPFSTTAKAQESLEIPVGTVLPVRLNHGFSSKSVTKGREITGGIMHDVNGPNGTGESRSALMP